MEYSKVNKLKLISSWLLILMAMLACETSSMERDDVGHISCQDHFPEGSWIPKASNCTYTCDNGTVIPQIFDENNPLQASVITNYCFPASSAKGTIATEEPTEVPTEAPTEPPTEASTEEPPAELPTSILTGEVTYCDLVSHSVNLRLVEGFSAEEFNHQVTIGGEVMSCKVNEGNATLLTCTFPVTVKFPVSIQVSQDGSIVNEFEYKGSNCIFPTGTKVKKDEEQESPPDDVVCDPDILKMDHVCVPVP